MSLFPPAFELMVDTLSQKNGDFCGGFSQVTFINFYFNIHWPEFWKLLCLQNDSSADQEVGKSGGQERR